MTKAETGRWPTISRLTCGDADAGDHGFYAAEAASALYSFVIVLPPGGP